MHARLHMIFSGIWLMACAAAPAALDAPIEPAARTPQGSATQSIDLTARLAAGTLRAVNQDVAPLPDRPGAVTVAERSGAGVSWIEGSGFSQGSIDVDVRGRDVPQQSFVGLAFHRRDDDVYDAVYLRPFNFRNTDQARRQNAVQYIAVPELLSRMQALLGGVPPTAVDTPRPTAAPRRATVGAGGIQRPNFARFIESDECVLRGELVPHLKVDERVRPPLVGTGILAKRRLVDGTHGRCSKRPPGDETARDDDGGERGCADSVTHRVPFLRSIHTTAAFGCLARRRVTARRHRDDLRVHEDCDRTAAGRGDGTLLR